MSKVLPHRSGTTTKHASKEGGYAWVKGQAKAGIKVFVAQRSRASNHMYRLRLLRENLIGDDNHEITKTWMWF